MDVRLKTADAVVFDVGNVLLSFDREQVISLLPAEKRAVMTRVLFGPELMWSRFDLGLGGNEAIAGDIARAAGFPEAADLALMLLRRFPEVMEPLPLYGMLEELRAAGKRLFALTNYPEPSFTLTCFRFPKLTELMEGAVVSAREKVGKPDPAVFRMLSDRYGLRPADTLFIDDVADNTIAAARLGFRVWHYAGDDRIL